MNYQEPLRINNIDLNQIVYPKIKSNQNKKIILLKYNDRNKLKNFVFQTPTLLNTSLPIINDSYAELEIAIVGKEKSKVSKFIKFLNNLENKIKEDARFNGANWFTINNDNQSVTFQKIIRESDTFQNGVIKIKLIKNSDFETVTQINNNKKISFNSIPENSWCKMILECYAIWINSNNDFGIFFRPILVSFTPIEKEIYNYNFVEDSEENEIDIPDTEIDSNIFMKINCIPSKNTNNSTTQLELNNLIDKLQSDNNDYNVLDMNLKNKYSESSSSSSADDTANFENNQESDKIVLASENYTETSEAEDESELSETSEN
jgi:hypothetical protein